MQHRYQGENTRNVVFMAVGAALLWFGWYGFNAGSELNIDSKTILAFINTDVSASFASISWLLIESITRRKREISISGLLTGAVAGLAAITPAAGYVSVHVAMFLGAIAGVVCFYFSYLCKKWVSDELDVFSVHGLGGVIGVLMLSFFSLNDAHGHAILTQTRAMFVLFELGSAVLVALYAFCLSYILLWLMKKILPGLFR